MITVEERVMIALIDYINAAPKHSCGLCYYLDDVTGNSCMSYVLIPLARKKMPEFGPVNSYISSDAGPTSRRLEFAAALLRAIETSDVYYCPIEGWKLS